MATRCIRVELPALPGDDSLSRRVLLIVYYRVNPAPIVHVDTPQRVKVPGEPDTVLTLNHINFIANKAELTEAAWDALPSNVANLRHFSDRYLEIDGRWEDHVRYAITSEEWTQRRGELLGTWISRT